MVRPDQIRKLDEWRWEIPQDTRKDMKVPAIIYASHALLESMFRDKSLEQLINVATLPGIRVAAMLMPDAHEGYGFPIGGVAATRYPEGAISPGGIGYDINCGVRLLRTGLPAHEVMPRAGELARELYRKVPSGVGRGGTVRLSQKQMNQVLEKGVAWAVEEGLGREEDLAYIESNGRLTEADPACVSSHAKERGYDQLGTIGSGNHFVEVDRVSQLFDPEAAKAFGLEDDQVTILIHTGSRGLGHQTATDYIRRMLAEINQYGILLPDRELVCLPFNSATGTEYFNAMSASANFAWCNREVITHEIREAWEAVFGKSAGPVSLVYDVAHNIAKIEEHNINGEKEKLIVHRKGATRAFGPGFTGLPAAYRPIGQPVLIPGSMGTASYVLAGTQQSMESTFGTACHGAGRRLSRHAAKKIISGKDLQDDLKKKGIHIQAGSLSGVAEEAPEAYKDVDLVVETIHEAGIATRVARLVPMVVIKG